MTNEQLSASLSYLGDELLAECGARRQRPKRSWRTALIKAACIALVLFSGIYVAGRFDYSLGAGCASSPGTIADGRYYYHVRHSGVWCYDPAMGTSERVLSTFWYDGYAVNGYGIYYLRGETLYVQVHETGERIKLYTAPQDCTRLFFSLLGDGRIDVRLRFNSYTIHQDKVPTDTEPNVPSWSYNDTIVWSEYLLDGRTGELLEVRQDGRDLTASLRPEQLADLEATMRGASRFRWKNPIGVYPLEADTVTLLGANGDSVILVGSQGRFAVDGYPLHDGETLLAEVQNILAS